MTDKDIADRIGTLQMRDILRTLLEDNDREPLPAIVRLWLEERPFQCFNVTAVRLLRRFEKVNHPDLEWVTETCEDCGGTGTHKYFANNRCWRCHGRKAQHFIKLRK